MKNICLCFCVRNCQQYLPSIFKNIEHLKIQLHNSMNIFSIFVYDNCSDNSEHLLKEYQNKYKDSVIIRNIINDSEYRTVRIAKAINTCLEIVYNELKNISFHIMIDSDDVCSSPWNTDLINKYLNNFDNDNWDCISFNRDNYYDIWALMYDDFKHHSLGFGDQLTANTWVVVTAMQDDIVKKLNNCKSNSIEVISAFNGFCIYKTEKLKEFYYDGLYSNIKNLITDEERQKTIQALKKLNLNDIYI